ncbi:DUF1642 domain-containing protein [Paenibacillus lupini]|uniref:DUF1642 domain-containing protein n=1 Tax=Paenibacillus lupini TaxID=1450204 RepID=UPI00142147A1|nr:DUF1642 domain-containing protein [Paenibacillus lupini]NIK24234.1 hypothetical protein [Paenibacillus lupini]
MRQSPEYMESNRNSASMQSVQRYGRDTILQLLSHIDTIETELKIATEDEERAVAAADRLTENVAKLYVEKQEFENQMNALRVPVVLPKEIAEAMNKLEAVGHTVDEAAWLIAHGGRADATEAEGTLNKYALRKNGFIQLVNALQYGYTVEEPINHEQRLRIELEKLITTWDGLSRYTLNKDVGELLTDHFQEIAK